MHSEDISKMHAMLKSIADQYSKGLRQAQREGRKLKKSFKPLSKALKALYGTR